MKKLLAVIDYQNDFVTGSLGFAQAQEIDTGIADLVQRYLAQGAPVLFTYDTHTDQYLQTREGRALPVPHCLDGTSGWRLYGQTQLICRDTCATHQIHTIHKKSFAMSPADAMRLQADIGEIDHILIVGVVTNICVISNAVMLQASWPEAQITVDAALCRSFNPDLHEKALDVMDGLQIQVINR